MKQASTAPSTTPPSAAPTAFTRASPQAWCTLASPLGDLWAAATDQGLCGLWFAGQRHGPTPGEQAGWPAQEQPFKPRQPLNAAQTWLQEAQQQLQHYWDDASPFDLQSLPLDWRRGTAFQRQVWQALLTIREGQTSSYGELASRLGQPQAARAVGAAVGRNPWSLLVPCHRVLGQGGALTGYAGGLDRKRWLLRHEGAAVATDREVAA